MLSMDPTPAEVASFINSNCVPGWPKVTADSIRLSRVSSGNINRTYKVEKLLTNETHGDEDSKNVLIYKAYGKGVYDDIARKIFPRNTALTQTLIFYEQSERGWGPKLYAATEDARLEEFIDSHTLTSDEAFKPEIRDDLAKAYARFHSLDLPLSKKPYDFIADILRFNEGRAGLIAWLKSSTLDESERASVQRLLDFPYEKEHKWLKSVSDKLTHRIVMSTNDPQHLNRLVRKEKPVSQSDATQCVIIDFDTSSYAPRGFDLGGHFACCDQYPDKKDREAFLVAYRQQSKVLLNDFDDNGLDSIENLMCESYFYSLVYVSWLISFAVNMYEVYHLTPQLKLFFDFITDNYTQLKSSFCAEYNYLRD